MQYIDWLEPVVEICRAAGDAILDVYNTEFTVDFKDDRSPLTNADRASHEHILQHLTRLTPDIPVLSEESAVIEWSTRRHWDPYWLVDPLDGTKEFVNRNGEFTVNVALIYQHRPVMGVVHVPVANASYFGAHEFGAWKSSGTNRERIHTRTCAETPIVVGSRSHAGDSLKQFLQKLGNHHLTPMGSSLKFCLVAEGKADVYPRFGPTSEWDTAAAHAVVDAAGGSVQNLNAQDLRYNTGDHILNPWFVVSGDPGFNWQQYLPDNE
ncbi:MAG: 3'(2'),5'-bisphosphate nucleotidase CysQ [Gammaproteobacteria bacterium]|nr:3'(2'),5'-bisphosphate nucleotidase CysQ [Gammaproteobacteria bacterium]